MQYEPIVKTESALRILPNLRDYERARRSFSWDEAFRQLDGLPNGRGLNMAHEAIDCHAAGANKDKVALRWIPKAGNLRDFSYLDLQRGTNQFANVLRKLGVGPRDRVFALAGRIPELYIAALGTLKNRSVFCPLFSAFGPEPIRARLAIGNAKVLVTTPLLFERKVAALLPSLPDLRHVLLVGDDAQPVAAAGTHDLRSLMCQASDAFEIEPTDPEDWALLHFTSGTTGTPKGAMHVHRAVVAHHRCLDTRLQRIRSFHEAGSDLDRNGRFGSERQHPGTLYPGRGSGPHRA